MAETHGIKRSYRFKDRTGSTAWFLTVIELAGFNKRGSALWRCRCVCGKEVVVQIRTTKPQSCGCKTNAIIGEKNRTHGKTRTSEYETWCHLRRRCEDSTDRQFPDYGGRGITVCERWRNSFENFIADMGERPGPKFTIERKNNNRGYEPDNCVWATKKTQARNRRSNLVFTFSGQPRCLVEICELTGASYDIAWKRLRRGKSIYEAIGFVGPNQSQREVEHAEER